MEIGIIGLGRMGSGMARRLARGGVRVIAYDQDRAQRDAIADEDQISSVESLAAIAAQITGERVVLMMLPAGDATKMTLQDLTPLLSAGDTVVDGANAYYRDSMARALELSQHGLRYVDAGVSGGIHGLANGYCLMLGGTPKSIEIFEPYARKLAPEPERGWLHCGPSGAGHYAKMIHNGIEYGLMQAYAEGFALLRARSDLGFDLAQLAETWGHGSVIRSWLLELCADILRHDEDLAQVAPIVPDSGEGRWTVNECVANAVSAPTIAASIFTRFASRKDNAFGLRVLAALRNEFGGHAVKKA